MRFELRQMPLRPPAKRVQRVDQRSPEPRERVFHFRRDDWMDFAHDQAVALEAAERLREHFLRDAADGPTQFGVALRSVRQDLDDERGPFVRDAIEDDTRRALRFQDRWG